MFIKKNVIILHPADKSACAFYRCDVMAALLRSDRSDDVEVIVSRPDFKEALEFSRLDEGIYNVVEKPLFLRSSLRH